LKARVTDKSSVRLSPCANLIAPSACEVAEIDLMPDRQPAAAAAISGGVVCQICGRRGRWIDPFAG
jgi:hypothetical protein